MSIRQQIKIRMVIQFFHQLQPIINNKEDLSLSSLNDTTIVNDTVPNWIQSEE